MGLLTPELGLFVWTLVAFLIVFLILRATAWKPILKGLGEREKGIADSIAAADRVRKEMAQMQSENEALMASAREERSHILKEAKEHADAIIAQAKSETRGVADKMIAEARTEIQNQKMAALTDVKNQIGLVAVDVAEKILRQKLGSEAAQTAHAQAMAQDINLN